MQVWKTSYGRSQNALWIAQIFDDLKLLQLLQNHTQTYKVVLCLLFLHTTFPRAMSVSVAIDPIFTPLFAGAILVGV